MRAGAPSRRARGPATGRLLALALAAAVLPAAAVTTAPAGADPVGGVRSPRPATTRPATAPARPATESGRSTRQLLTLGGIAIEEGDHPAAESLFREVIDLDPRLTQGHFGLALAALGRGDRRGAEKALRRAQELSPSMPEVLYARGVAALTFGDARQAETHLQSAAGADKSFLEARYALGIAAARRGDLKAAEAALRDALRLDNLHAASLYQLGAVLARAGDLDGSLSQLSRAIGREPGLVEARPEAPFFFGPRAVKPAAASQTLGLPLPAVRPALAWARRVPSPQAPPEIPDWYLYYQMAIQFEEAEAWQGVVDMLEKALAVKSRSESLAVVADRLVDYAPHLHLASAHHRLGQFQDAFLHLGLAKSQGEASPDAWQALNTVIQKDRLRPRIQLDPLPDRTPDQAITVRGLIVAEEPVQSVEVSGREAILRPATAEEVAERLTPEKGAPRVSDGCVLFEVAGFRLAEGTNAITIRPRFRNPARDGDMLEARVVRLAPPPPVETPAPTPEKPAPKSGPRKTTPKPKPVPPGSRPPSGSQP
jgi:tetratricopeptide (TPR) repeat protein